MLTNPIRRHFGIKEIDDNWKKLDVKDLLRGHVLVDNDNVIQKLIHPVIKGEFAYREVDHTVQLNDDLKIVGKRGKLQPLTAANFWKIKPDGKYFNVDEKSLQLVNHANGIQIFDEYDLNWETPADALGFLNRKIIKEDKFFSEELDLYLNRSKQVNQKIRQGDIFRVRLTNDKFAYGRVIADLANFLKNDTGIVSEWNVDFRGRSIFNEILVKNILVDFFAVISDSPYSMYKDLKEHQTTPTVVTTDRVVKHEACMIVDHAEVDPSSFDMPMELDTYYERKPICHIFKWGGCVVTFKAEKKIEALKDRVIKKEPAFYSGPSCRSVEYYINSCIGQNPDYAFFRNRGDLRHADYKELRAIISKHLDFDLNTNNYDAFANKYGFMDRAKFLSFTIR